MSTLPNTVPSETDSEYSIPTWKRIPTTKDVIFGLTLPYQPPKSTVGAFIWRKRMWFECTFALTMLTPWEKFLLVLFLNLLLIAFVTGVYLYLPTHLSFIRGRAMYYFLGQDVGNVPSITESFHRLTGLAWNSSNLRTPVVEGVASIVEL